MTLSPTLLIFLAYLLGSLPFGLILAYLFGHGDIRKIGSGNIGATNVLRTGKKTLAAMTLLLDMFKGTCAVWLALATIPELAPIAGLAAFLGHVFPLWLNFKGGKGVSTFLGVTAALYWPLALMVTLVWLSTASLMKTSSLAALFAVISAPIFIDIFQVYEILPSCVIMMIFVIAKHHTNIIRLATGTEPKIGHAKN